MSVHALGALRESLAVSRASTTATSRSPFAVLLGTGSVNFDPNVVAVATPPPEGSPLNAGPEPATVIPKTNASARNPRWRGTRRLLKKTRILRDPSRVRRVLTAGGVIPDIGSLSSSVWGHAGRRRKAPKMGAEDGPFSGPSLTASWALALGA